MLLLFVFLSFLVCHLKIDHFCVRELFCLLSNCYKLYVLIAHCECVCVWILYTFALLSNHIRLSEQRKTIWYVYVSEQEVDFCSRKYQQQQQKTKIKCMLMLTYTHTHTHTPFANASFNFRCVFIYCSITTQNLLLNTIIYFPFDSHLFLIFVLC